MLYNSRDPYNRKRRIFLPYLDEQTYDLISNSQLSGGFSANHAVFSNFNYGMKIDNEPLSNTDYAQDQLSHGIYVDYNRFDKSQRDDKWQMMCDVYV